MAFNGCRKTDKSKTTSVEATVEPEVIDEVPELTSEDFNVDPNNELSIIEKRQLIIIINIKIIINLMLIQKIYLNKI